MNDDSPRAVSLDLDLAEAEAVIIFLGDRSHLWDIEARGCGVNDPMRLCRRLAVAYRDAIKSAVKSEVAVC